MEASGQRSYQKVFPSAIKNGYLLYFLQEYNLFVVTRIAWMKPKSPICRPNYDMNTVIVGALGQVFNI